MHDVLSMVLSEDFLATIIRVAVSYTHLDVYKRQVLAISPLPAALCGVAIVDLLGKNFSHNNIMFYLCQHYC